MADDGTSEGKVVRYLKQCPSHSASDKELVDGTGLSLLDLRMLLRQLKRRRVIKEEGSTSDKKWTLVRPDKEGGGTGNKQASGQTLEERVLQYLRSHSPTPQKAIDIAKGLRIHKKKEVNHVLYKLKDSGKVIFEKTDKAPMWRLPGGPSMFRPTQHDAWAPGAYNSGFVPEGMYSPAYPPPGYGHMVPHGLGSFRGHPSQRRQPGLLPVPQRSPGNDRWGGGERMQNYSPPHQPGRGRGRGRMRGRGRGQRRGWRGGQGQGRGQGQWPRPDQGTQDSDSFTRPASESMALAGQMTQSSALSQQSTSSVTVETKASSGMAAGNGQEADAGNSQSQKTNTSTGVRADDMAEKNVSFEDDDDLNLEYDGESDISDRMYDMMGGGLDFGSMGYDYDVDMNEEDYNLPDQVLWEMNSNPDGAHSCVAIAMVLDVTDSEVKEALRDCEEKGLVAANSDQSLWSLTDEGKAYVAKLMEPNDADISDEPEEPPSTGPFSVPPPAHHGPPPPPKELIKNDPVFGADYSQRADSLPPFGVSPQEARQPGQRKGRGRGLLGIMEGLEKVNVKGVTRVEDLEAAHLPKVSGTFDVQDLEAVQTGMATSVGSASLSSQAQSAFDDAAENVGASTSISQGSGWVPLSEFTKPATPSASTNAPSAASEAPGPSLLPPGPELAATGMSAKSPAATEFHSLQVTASQHHMRTTSVPHTITSGVSGPSLIPQMQNAIPAPGPLGQEGLVFIQPQGTQVSVSPRFHLPPTPLQILGQQPEKTSTSPTYASLESALPRSHSQPVLGSGPMSLPAADTSNPTLQITSESFAALNKNPISALMEYAQSRRMQAMIEVVKQSGPSHRPVFVMAARVGTRMFPGVTCHNKKDGRKEAADMALRTLIAEGQYSAAAPTPSVSVPAENMTHFDKVAALTHQTFNSLIASIPENLAGRKVIAGLVMKRSKDDVGIVISIGTGNRCITGDKLSLEGNTVNDSHAEIITRRGFMRFLYQQLLTYEEGKSHELFEKGSTGKLRVRSEITFHLYISTAPCGDGALFSPRDVESNSGLLPDVNLRDHHPTFTNNVQGLLRTKMEGGEGTIPIDASDITVQTWDGVVRGERLRTMSCTDKICRWNVLGMQGALLSHFLEPVYLDSLTLGFLYDHGHLSRAVCCRLDRGDPPLDGVLPQPFHLNHPWLGRVTACQPLRETQKTKAFSINWTVGDQKPEVLDGTLGHCYTAVEKKLFSRVAKRCMYDSFKQVAGHFSRSDLLQMTSYRNAKMAAVDFQTSKVTLMKKFQQTGCGSWVKKPVEEEMFS